MWTASCREVMALSNCTSLYLAHFRPLTCAISHHSRLAPHPPDLLKWVRREGGFVHDSVRIAQVSSYGLGLVASDEIPEGADLISLPPHLPLKFDKLYDGSSSVLTTLAQQVPEELWAMRLGLKLLQERAKTGSFWWPYISNLPEIYTVPIFFQREDIKNLQYGPLLFQVDKRCGFLLDFEKQVKYTVRNLNAEDHPFGGQDVDASSLGWAMSAVSSRAFRLHGNERFGSIGKDVPMMLPLIDMCNHSFYPNAKVIQDQDVQNSKILVKAVAEKHINRDVPVELNYGCLSNDVFLLDYGFVVTANPYDTVELKYDTDLLNAASVAAGVYSPSFSSPASWQREILSSLKLDGKAPLLKVTLGGPELVEGRFLAALRVLHATDVETLYKHDLITLQSLSTEAPLGISNEVAVLQTIIGLCVVVLEHFDTRIMEDQSLLKGSISSLSELAIRFRIEKKSLIVNVMREMSKRARLIQSKEANTAA